jgi:cyclopropane-fatty-acyl-phospholipid synthase
MSIVQSRGRAGKDAVRPHHPARPTTVRGPLAPLIEMLLGVDPPIAFEGYEGTRLGPADPAATLVVRSPDALRRIVTAPGELGLARAYVAGDLDLDGDIFAAFEIRRNIEGARIGWREVLAILRAIGPSVLRPLPAPPEEMKPRGRLHSISRDASAISHHYDVSNEFYELLLGPTMTYSCAVWEHPSAEALRGAGTARELDEAQEAKYELICRKLALEPGMRLLDVGCGWGGMVRHAARYHGVEAVGITISAEQARWARARVEAEGLSDQVEIRLQDYRDVHDGPYDAISSIGMFEHVGRARLRQYFQGLYDLLVPGGRLLNHAISRPPNEGERINPRGFMGRYVFPDGELIEVGSVVTELQAIGFEARHVEDLREHYALTLRAWVANLEANWDRMVELAGEPRARIWRLYLAGCAVNFDDGATAIHQVLGVKLDQGRSSMPWRPYWDRLSLRRWGARREDDDIILV